MKKLVLALAVIASVSMISCTNNAEQANEEVTEDTTMVVEEAPVDSTVVADSTVAAPAEGEAAPEAAAPEAAPAE